MLLPYSNLQLKHQNPGATKPLILPVHVICNTDDEAIHNNIRTNSLRPGQWLKIEEAHDRIAVICGSGPSLADTLDEIKELASKEKVDVFALNGAANFIDNNGITADYQVIIDAREETADLVGVAANHLFASQVHPKCFERAPLAKVWHLQIEGIDDLLPPDYAHDCALVGGAASVGNTATCLAYAMGYRKLHLFGYDSCHKGDAGHAFRQPLNDGDPCASVRFNGKDYIASLTMKLQAEKFMQTSRALQQLGVEIEVHGYGLLPDMWRTPVEQLTEQEKYQRMWDIPGYREVAPGEYAVDKFVSITKPHGLIIDFGCGTGRASLKLKELGHEVLLVDFASNSRDTAALKLPFIEWDLTQEFPMKGEYGFCTDVMEHIPPADVDKVINNIMLSVKTAFFQISTVPDHMGACIGHHLHLTVEQPEQWKRRFERLGYCVTHFEHTNIDVTCLVTK